MKHHLFIPRTKLMAIIAPLCLGVLLLAGLFSLIRAAGPGELDLGFDADGVKTTDIGLATGDIAYGVAISGTKIVVAGTSAGNVKSDFAVVRYNNDGTLDTTFDADGIVTTTINGLADVAYDVAIQSDGKIIAVGSAGLSNVPTGDFALVRYNNDGSLDTTFGPAATGIVTTSFSTGFDVARAVAIQSDGKIVVAGTSGNATTSFTVARYKNNGTLDTTFSSNGWLTTTVGAADDAQGLLIQPDGKIVVAGTTQGFDSGSDDFALLRFDTNGILEFSTTTDLGNNEFGLDVALQPDGKIVVAGHTENVPNGIDFLVARYDSSGNLDTTSFNAPFGVVTVTVSSLDDEAFAVSVQPTGKIVLAGLSNDPVTNENFTIVRLNSDGSLDTNFGINATGIVTTDIGFAETGSLLSQSKDLPYGMAIQSNAFAVVVGLSDHPTLTGGDDNFAIVRYQLQNTIPTVSGVSKSGSEDNTITFAQLDFTAAFTDTDGDSLQTVKILSLPANGTLKLGVTNVTISDEISAANLNTLTYTPDAEWNGVTTFDWNGSDGLDYAAASATVTITVNAVNDPPSFTKGSDESILEDAGPQTVTGWATNISTGPADEAGQVITFTLVSGNPSLFAVQPTVSPTGTLQYTPADNANGSTTISISLQDSGGGDDTSTTQQFNISIQTVNDAPTFTPGGDQAVAEDAGQQITTWATNIQPGPADESAQTVSFAVVNNNNGLFSQQPAMSSAGVLSYTSALNVFGTAVVTVTAQDNGGTVFGGVDQSAPVTFTISVSAVNDAPTLTNFSKSGSEDNSILFTSTDFSSHFTDVDGDSMTQVKITSLPPTSAGSLKLSSTSVITNDVISTANLANLAFVPAQNWNGNTSFNWNGFDGTAYAAADATVNITVTAVNDIPTFTGGPDQAVLEDTGPQTVSAWASGMSAGPADEQATQTITFTTSTNNDALFSTLPAVDELSGDLTYTPAANMNGSATVTVTLQDSGGGTNTSVPFSFTITITPVNDLPVVSPVTKNGTEDTILSFTSSDFTNQFSDVDTGDTLTMVKIASEPAHGILKLNGVQVTLNQEIPAASLGGLTFVPDADWNGTTIFNWNGSDGTGYATSNSTVSITLAAVNDPPIFTKGADQTVNEDSG
ncbi:MAG: tandem-95 repeat protein, partial [Anaerolineae bacterium]